MHDHRSLLIVAACLAASTSLAADAPRPAGAVLRLANGGFLPGQMNDVARAGVVRWTSPAFVTPFDFQIGGINAIEFPAPSSLPKPTGDYAFELTGGDVLFGTLLGLDDKVADVDVAKLGRLHIDRTRLLRIIRWSDGADLIYLGPNGLAGWIDSSAKPSWREAAGQLVADGPGELIRNYLGLPTKAAIEFELSWTDKPDFTLALGVGMGVGPEGTNIEHAVRFEVWDGELVVVRESETEAELAPVQPIAAGSGRLHLLVNVDQETGRVLIYSTDGKRLAELKGFGTSKPSPGIAIQNKGGEVQLERLRVSRWNGEAPTSGTGDKSRIQRTDGTRLTGNVTRYDAPAKQFVIKEDSRETRVAADKLAGITFLPAAVDHPRSIRLIFQDGSRLSGELTRVEKGDVWMTAPGVVEPFHVPAIALRSMVGLQPDPKPVTKDVGIGRLESDGLRLDGKLAEAGDASSKARLGWMPTGALNASPFRPGVAAKVVYREPKPVVPTVAQPVQQQRGVGIAGGLLRIFGVSSPSRVPAIPQKPERRALHLRTGDIISAEVSKIDENGVTFRTPISEGTFVAHDKLKAVELSNDAPAIIRLNKSKRERLLTLPRMQKDSPPTQLIRSKTGDYLRGRVTKMDDKTLQVEVRLETKYVPRDRIARIIWLHADEVEGAKPPKAPVGDGSIRVQAVKSDGYRLTFAADRLVEKTLFGKSEVLGNCRVALDDVDQLLINGAIEQAAAGLEYQKWKLHNAAEPKYVSDDGAGSETNGMSGKESPMVGKPAPDFTLNLLSGKSFHLAETKGKVVVLDFWATWCGPCLQAMPQVDRVTREFADRGVQLVAVNLQEGPKEITAMLERHKLSMAVALDRDGATAEKYKANAIPQTVIIDRDGSIARLFVGGGPHFDDQLREALKAVVDGKKGEDVKK
jgi:peroxiredoxin